MKLFFEDGGINSIELILTRKKTQSQTFKKMAFANVMLMLLLLSLLGSCTGLSNKNYKQTLDASSTVIDEKFRKKKH